MPLDVDTFHILWFCYRHVVGTDICIAAYIHVDAHLCSLNPLDGVN